MLFNFFNCENKKIVKEESNSYLTKKLTWDTEKLTAIRLNDTQRIMYYKDIIRVDIIFINSYLPVPKWTIQDDNLEDITTIDFYNDLEPILTELVFDMFSKKLKGYDNNNVHKTIIEAMGATSGFFHVWGREDLEQVLKQIWDSNKDKIEANIEKAMNEEKQRKEYRWWKNIFKSSI